VNAFSSPIETTYIEAGDSHTCAISRGKAYCWGYGTGLGSNQTGAITLPTLVDASAMSAKVISISGGQGFSCAVADKAAYCWGDGGSGRLGNGATTQQGAPVLVSQPASL